MSVITLTEEVAQQLEFYWQLAGAVLSDEQICDRIGIRFPQLRGWLQRNSRPRKPDGTLGEKGLRDIRVRAKASTMTGYLARLNEVARNAESAGVFHTAAQVYEWLLEKQFPRQFGRQVDTTPNAGRAGVLRVGQVLTEEQWQAKHGPKQPSIAQT